MNSVRLLVGFCLAATAALLPTTACATEMPQSDTVLGAGSAGPYKLSWTHFDPGPYAVSENGAPLLDELDYTIDPLAGTITFTHPLTALAPVHIQYTYDTTTAQPNAAPLKLSLDENDKRQLYALAWYRPQAGNAGSQGSTTLGVGATWTGSGSRCADARIYFAPPGAQGPVKGNGVSLTARTDVGRKGVLSMGYSRAETAFDAGADPGLAAGRQQLSASYRASPSPTISTNLSYRSATDLNGGAGSRTSGASVTVEPVKAVQIGANVSVLGLAGQSTTTSNVNIIARPINTAKGQGAGTTVVVTAGGASVNGVQNTQQTTIGTTVTQATALGSKSAPMLRLSAGYQSRATSNAATPNLGLDTSQAGVALQSGRVLTVSGHIVQNPADSGTPIPLRRRGVGIETHFGAMSLTGGIDWLLPAGAESEYAETTVGVGLHLGRGADLTGGYKQSPAVAGALNPGVTCYSVGYKHSLSDTLNVAVAGTSTMATTVASAGPQYGATASFGVKF